MSDLKKILRRPELAFLSLGYRGWFCWMPDELYIKIAYLCRTHKKLSLKNPRSFNEKLQWLKLYDRRPEYTNMADKYEAKKYAARIIGRKYIIPTLGVWNKFEEIDFQSLPDVFVLKCTHDSGSVVICRDKKYFNIKHAKKVLNAGMRHNPYWGAREWPYKNIKPRIIAEKYMEDESGVQLKDYKLFNFHGEPKLIQVDYDRFTDHKRNLYTTGWKYLNAAIQFPSDKNMVIERPQVLEEMLELAGKLSAGIPHVRTDFYCIGKRIYFGEMTFYHGGGMETFYPETLGLEMGKWIVLPGRRNYA